MKEKNRIIADKHRNLSIQKAKKQNPIHSDQVIDRENIEKIRKFLMKRLPKNPLHEKVDNIEPDKTVKSDKKNGSHSLSELYYFQNQHK